MPAVAFQIGLDADSYLRKGAEPRWRAEVHVIDVLRSPPESCRMRAYWRASVGFGNRQ